MFGCCSDPRSPHLSPIEIVWCMVAERLTCHRTPASTIDDLWHCVEAAWASIPIDALKSLFDSMPRCISAVVTSRGGCSGY
ncbi:hypothetical protein TNCV_2290641 [Trichonephila clavipes]|uniref:Uncharacterized protein n=1 Tax=Trichonephila clavipes TaxID=2585209 RepID=A0A8X6RL28_TRICX|nr:hypothetical protein TNCV_2290641 [Trichonephila clavipes]